MKKLFILLVVGLLASVCAYAADMPTAQAPDNSAMTKNEVKTDTTVQATAQAPAAQAAPAVPAAEAAPAALPAAAQAPANAAASTTAPAANADNLEFVSGEISATDEATKSITIKLYGETENAAKDKTLTVKVDSTTDITDGEKDRDFKSLTAGTEVDVEYDPTTKKATYIFVY